MRDYVFIFQTTVEELGHNVDEFPISKSSIQRIRTEIQKERAKAIKVNFKNEIPNFVSVHWNRELFH